MNVLTSVARLPAIMHHIRHKYKQLPRNLHNPLDVAASNVHIGDGYFVEEKCTLLWWKYGKHLKLFTIALLAAIALYAFRVVSRTPERSPPTFPTLQGSFRAIYHALEIPKNARRVVCFVLLIHAALLAYSAYVHSPTLNEPAHLAAGLSHWKFGRFALYRVNPPLVWMVAALPVMAVGYREDWSGFYEGPGARPEAALGEDFFAANGERSLFLFMIARWACIPFSWIGAIVC